MAGIHTFPEPLTLQEKLYDLMSTENERLIRNIVNDEGDTRYNNPMFKLDVTSSQAGTMTVSILNKDKHVECQLQLPTEHELYVSGRGIIDTNCMGIARRQEFE
ncbi:hypothetical protein DPMN_189400 [Dreissena polymorpha]|uniref:Uncharacterized protein n=1 Tax=Dreissena polymorpha TaxID=45954 RepID=A0A9D4IAZ6_DREPO|nr:hypothetical protein DPMN_189400 [Dreissena polymorpha]